MICNLLLLIKGFDAAFGRIVSHCWCRESIAIAFEHGHVMVLDVTTYSNQHLECGKEIKCMDAVFVADLGFVIVLIDSQSVRFLKLSLDGAGWTTIAMLDYNSSDWILKDETPVHIQLTPDGKHSVLTGDAGSVVLHKLMM